MFPSPPRLQHSPSLPEMASTKARAKNPPKSPARLLTPPLTPSSSIRTNASLDISPAEPLTGGDVPSRFLLITNCSPTVPQAVVKSAIENSIAAGKLACYRSSSPADEQKPIKAYFFGALPEHGHICFAFHDIRDAIAAHHFFDSADGDDFDERVGLPKDTPERQRITCKFLTMDQVTSRLGTHPFLKSMDPTFDITVEKLFSISGSDDGEKDALLAAYIEGDSEVRSIAQSFKTFRIECHDIRSIVSMYESLDGKEIAGMKLSISRRHDQDADQDAVATEEKPAIVPFPIFHATADSVELFGPPGHFSQTRQPFAFPPQGARISGPASPHIFYESPHATGIPVKSPGDGSLALDPQRHHHQLVQHYYNPPVDGYPHHLFDVPPKTLVRSYFPLAHTPPPYHHGFISPGALHPAFDHEPPMIAPIWPIEIVNGVPTYVSPFVSTHPPPHDPYWPGHIPLPGTVNPGFPPGLPLLHSPAGYIFPPPADQQLDLQPTESPPRRGSSSSPEDISKNLSASPTSSSGKKQPSEHNQLNLARIEDGLDTRTTIMIKNIPNKMSDKNLLEYIAKVCPRRIDFLYLRMDFKNGCNVGYAFVNFISVSDLLSFAKQRLGQKWNMFSSEKVLQMSYANYQGKEALVEKFKNSCIMDEREEWQPKIFISEPGHSQGLPEPFPAPTHQRRKERSSHNRGALYVPGNSSLQTQHLLNTTRFSPPPRRLESQEPAPRTRNYHPHRRQRTTPSRE
ncbi:hypothetical protein D9757_000661 [Collybiopsis confluens]|uniref:Mei2-like C-terminal RNA recognition motif domain-containing protein n=1 Tax=Collybiopsis confluens TaxID=2823264 RepID=A0A8H5I1H0_9AGAR|nr:hypothetical protein D9757_000661 [Collybiopsis confluens]